MSYTIDLSVTCSVKGCGTVHSEKYVICRGQVPPVLNFPATWTEVFGHAFCPKHKIKLLIDGEPHNAI